MITEICKENSCTGCKLCYDICPQKCIDFVEDECGFEYPVINHNNCINCNLCKIKCPSNQSFKTRKGSFYMGIHKDYKILKESSSGGAFSAIAALVLKNNGIVVGATIDDESKIVKHIVVKSKEELYKLRKSKYYQSDTKNIYCNVLEQLKDGKNVLLSGTACQIAAAYSYIPPIYYDKLLTVDVLCHGVSSKKIVDSFIRSEEKRFNKKVKKYYFRIKESFGWQSGGGTKMKLVFEDGSTHIEENSIDDFFLAFNKNVALRESCYDCKYCGVERISDFTIADFWGITEKRANLEQQKQGVSVITFNSDKARQLKDRVEEYIHLEKVDPSEVVPYNNAFIEPNKRPINRDKFSTMMENNIDFHNIINELYWKYKLKMKIKLLLGPAIISKIKRLKNVGKNRK